MSKYKKLSSSSINYSRVSLPVLGGEKAHDQPTVGVNLSAQGPNLTTKAQISWFTLRNGLINLLSV